MFGYSDVFTPALRPSLKLEAMGLSATAQITESISECKRTLHVTIRDNNGIFLTCDKDFLWEPAREIGLWYHDYLMKVCEDYESWV